MSAPKKPLSISLPEQAVKRLEALIPCGLYGATRAEVASNLILSSLIAMVRSGEFVSLTDDPST